MKITKLLLVLLFVCVVSVQAQAEKRIALIIGNSAYQNTSPLRNTVNDANLMAETLSNLGFEVIKEVNANFQKMEKAVEKFGLRLHQMGNVDIALFYYSGHGVQIDGVNYVLPIDVKGDNQAELKSLSIAVKDVQNYMNQTPSRVNVIVMDACRNDPFKGKTRSLSAGTKGLAPMQAAKGTLIAYATSPGDTASDGRGINSPYTDALSRALRIPNLSVERVFKEARTSVIKETDGDQTPWEASSLTGADVYFNGKAAPTQSTIPTPTPVTAKLSRAEQDWNEIKDSNSMEFYFKFAGRYPDSEFADLARDKIVSLQVANHKKKKQTTQQILNKPKPAKVEDDYVIID